MTTNADDAVNELKRLLERYQPRARYWIAYLGDGNGNVRTSSENHCLCRYPLVSSTPVEIYNTKAPLIDGIRVAIGYTNEQPNLLQVLDVIDQRLDTTVPDGSPPPNSGYSIINNHAVNHSYLNVDPVYLNWRQITPLGVFPTYPGSMSVQIRAGYIPRPGADTWVSDQSVDLTAYQPGSGALYALISFDTTGAVVVTPGPTAADFASLTAADIPDTPAGNWRSAAVVLYAGQSAIVENRSEIDIYDLRFPEESTAGSVVLPLTHNHIYVGDATNTAGDVPVSGDATIDDAGALTLAASGVTAGSYGDATHLLQVTVDSKGRITAISEIAAPHIGQHLEIVMAPGVTPPAPVSTPDDTDWVYAWVTD